MSRRNTQLAACGLILAIMTTIVPASAAEPIKVVYHLTEGLDQATRALGNIRNHLQAEPDTKIVVVTNGEGMRFLLAGARDRNGKLFDEPVVALAERGVEFRVCGNTLVAHQVPESRLLPQAKIVTSGVVEASRLQAREGYAYLRP